MQKILILLSIAAFSLCCNALHAAEVIHVGDNAGNTVSFLLSDRPVVTFDDENLIINTDVTKVFYPLSAYHSIKMETATGISAVASSEPVFSFGDDMSVQGLHPGTSVTIYSVNGTVLAEGTSDSLGMISLTVNAPKGTVCIVKTANLSFKFIK